MTLQKTEYYHPRWFFESDIIDDALAANTTFDILKIAKINLHQSFIAAIQNVIKETEKSSSPILRNLAFLCLPVVLDIIDTTNLRDDIKPLDTKNDTQAQIYVQLTLSIIDAHEKNLALLESVSNNPELLELEVQGIKYERALTLAKKTLNTLSTANELHYFTQAIIKEVIDQKTKVFCTNRNQKDRLHAIKNFISVLTKIQSIPSNHDIARQATDFGIKMLQSKRYKKLGQLLMGLGTILFISIAIAAGLMCAGLLGLSLYNIQMSTILLIAAALGTLLGSVGKTTCFFADKKHPALIKEGYQHTLAFNP